MIKLPVFLFIKEDETMPACTLCQIIQMIDKISCVLFIKENGRNLSKISSFFLLKCRLFHIEIQFDYGVQMTRLYSIFPILPHDNPMLESILSPSQGLKIWPQIYSLPPKSSKVVKRIWREMLEVTLEVNSPIWDDLVQSHATVYLIKLCSPRTNKIQDLRREHFLASLAIHAISLFLSLSLIYILV